MSEAPERIYIKRGWSDAHDGVWNSTKNLRGEELPPEEDEIPYVNADHLAALQAENDNLKAALDAQEQDAGLADGNLWRFWSRKAREVAKENERLRELLTECSDDLAAELEARYPEASRVYPGEARRYARDMDVIIRARAALKGDTP